MPSGRAGDQVLLYSDDVNLLEENSMDFNAEIILLKANDKIYKQTKYKTKHMYHDTKPKS
jgi:hypothetical protein